MISAKFAGLAVEVIAADNSGPFTRVKIRYPLSPDTPAEWVAADAVFPVPDPDLEWDAAMYEIAADVAVLMKRGIS